MHGLVSSFALATALLANSPELPAQFRWQSDYGQALTAARSSERPLLVVFERPSGDQAQAKSVSLTKSEAFDSLLAPYELCRIDVSTKYGQKVAEVFRATEFPYAVITDKSAQNIIYRHFGALTGAQWTSTLVEYQNGRRPEICFT